jgi:hypothetical protein
MGDEKCVKDLVGKSEGKRPQIRLRHRWDYDIKIDFKEAMKSIDLPLDRNP